MTYPTEKHIYAHKLALTHIYAPGITSFYSAVGKLHDELRTNEGKEDKMRDGE